MVEIEQSNLSAINWVVRPASVNSTTIFLCSPDNIACVYDMRYCDMTMYQNREEPLFYNLITVWYVTVPVYHSAFG